MPNKNNKAYKAEYQEDKVLLTPLVKNKDNNFVKVSIVLTDREKYMQRIRDKTKQGRMLLEYLYFDLDYNKDEYYLDKKEVAKELGLSDRGVSRGIKNLIDLGYMTRTTKQSTYLINSDLFFKGIRTKKQKEIADKVFNTYIDNRTVVINVMDEKTKQEILTSGFGIIDVKEIK